MTTSNSLPFAWCAVITKSPRPCRGADCEKQRHLADWVPPKIESERAEERAKEDQAQGDLLQFEAAWSRFEGECGEEYARPAALTSAYNALIRFFAGKRLNEVTRVDVRRYYVERMTNTGAFEKWPRKIGRRAPDSEVAFLGALYTFLQDEGHAIENPCHRPRSRKKDSPLRPYRPKRSRVIPTTAQLREIFAPRSARNPGATTPRAAS